MYKDPERCLLVICHLTENKRKATRGLFFSWRQEEE